MIEFIIIISSALLLHYIYFLLRIINGLQRLKSKNINHNLYSVSVIIPFRNESENILNSYKSIINQDYPTDKVEIIYVDDHSDDDSYQKLCLAVKENPKVKILSLNDNKFNGKKAAVTYGIENASNDLIVLTDADCTYHGSWVTSLVKNFSEDTGFLAGPVELEDNGTIFTKLQKLEFAGLVYSGAGLIGNKTPIICNAANIAFFKGDFFRINGFEDTRGITSGDDELLMYKIRTLLKKKVSFAVSKETIVKTKAASSLSSFLTQRKRWGSKTLSYQNKFFVFKLLLIFFFYLSLIFNFFLSFLYSEVFTVFLVSLSLKAIIEFVTIHNGNQLIEGQVPLKYLLLAEMMQIPYIIYSSLAGILGNYDWKGRIIKK